MDQYSPSEVSAAIGRPRCKVIAVTSTSFDVVGVGNAIVDVITQTTDDFVASQDLVKGSMNLIDDARAHELYALLATSIETSGGSVANTMVGIASFGGSASFIGKVADDELGAVYGDDMRAVGVSFDNPEPRASSDGNPGPATGRSMILVTPDAQRTMSTYLGISSLLEPEDVSAELVASSAILFCEGYLWDVDSAKAAIRHAMAIASGAGRKASLTLSDGFCVERHNAEFRELVAGPVDILFANEDEITKLYGTSFDAAVALAGQDVPLACVTRGKLGSLMVEGTTITEIDAVDVGELVDTTGAGDQYAAGVLYGMSNNFDLSMCGHLGSLAAAEVISHVGPRPRVNLRELAALELGEGIRADSGSRRRP